jgi:hypothetical protein
VPGGIEIGLLQREPGDLAVNLHPHLQVGQLLLGHGVQLAQGAVAAAEGEAGAHGLQLGPGGLLGIGFGQLAHGRIEQGQGQMVAVLAVAGVGEGGEFRG